DLPIQDTDDQHEQAKDDEHDDSRDSRNEALQFLQPLLAAIYSSKVPAATTETGPASQTVLLVRQFLEHAKDFLPEMTEKGTAVPYPASSFLRSTALQLPIEMRKHYKNGSIELCKK
ncbi:hypothetical protein BGX33_003166, partial [Mortierella sp. NVP41]